MADFAAEIDEGPLKVSQIIFDAMVAQEEEEGATLAEAIENVVEQLADDDTTGVFVYTDAEQKAVADKIMKSVMAVKKCASGEETYVNASFALQGLQQMTKGSTEVVPKALALMHGEGIVESLVAFCQSDAEMEEEEGEQQPQDKDDDDSDEEDDEEAVAKGSHAMEFLVHLLRTSVVHTPSLVPSAFTLSGESVQRLCTYLDDNGDMWRVVAAFARLASALAAANIDNISTLRAVEAGERLDLALTMHKKKLAAEAAVGEACDALTAALRADRAA